MLTKDMVFKGKVTKWTDIIEVRTVLQPLILDLVSKMAFQFLFDKVNIILMMK